MPWKTIHRCCNCNNNGNIIDNLIMLGTGKCYSVLCVTCKEIRAWPFAICPAWYMAPDPSMCICQLPEPGRSRRTLNWAAALLGGKGLEAEILYVVNLNLVTVCNQCMCAKIVPESGHSSE